MVKLSTRLYTTVKLSNTACWVSFILLDVQLTNSSSGLRAPRSSAKE
jgi:hypothetical protein